MTGTDQNGPSWEEAKGQWNRITDRVATDIPLLYATRLRATPPSSGLLPFGESAYANFVRYLQALDDVCQQAVYTLERLPLFTSREWSTPWELYVKYYLCDFLSRVKTATDLIALALNTLFDLRLKDEQCSLEKGKVRAALRRCENEGDPQRATRAQVAVRLDGARSEWIEPFYDLRNLVIHRNGLKLGGRRHPDTGENYIFVLAGGLLDVADDRKTVDQIVKRLDLLEDALTITRAIEPVNLCEQLWTRLAALVNSVLDQSKPQIDRFISDERAAQN